jgi:hypothetical protein
MGSDTDTKNKFPPEVGSLYSFSKDWKPTKQVSNITVSNGLAWSEDLKSMYYIDTATRKVHAFDLDAENVKICKYSCFNRQHDKTNIVIALYSTVSKMTVQPIHLHILPQFRMCKASLLPHTHFHDKALQQRDNFNP